MEFTLPEILEYVSKMSEAEPALLAKLNRETHLKILYPRMLSGHYQGRLLAFFSQMIAPKRILEIGTFTGYSTICLAEGLQEGGELISLEINEELKYLILPHLKAAGLQDNVQVRFGHAMELLPEVEGEFDLVFIDADKQHYLAYYELILPKLRAGGYILADNVLWHGKVLDDSQGDKETRSLREFNEFVSQDRRVACLMLPVRDGIMLIRKK